MPFGVKYKICYQADNGDLIDIRFLVNDYEGDITTWKSGPTPITFRKNAGELLFDKAIVPTLATITFKADTRIDITEFVVDRQTIKCELYNVTTETVEFSGWVEAYNGSQPYSKPPYFVTLSAGCGLSHLSKIRYNPQGIVIVRKKTYASILYECLLLTGHTLPRSVLALVRDSAMTTLLDPMGGALVDTDRYFDGEGKRLFAGQVIEDILQKWNAKLFQEDNQWKVLSIPEHFRGYRATFNYDAAGVYQTTATSIQVVNVNDTVADPLSLEGGDWSPLSPIKKYNAVVDFGRRKNLIDNGDLRLTAGTTFDGWTNNMGTAATRVDSGNAEFPYALKIAGTTPYPFTLDTNFWGKLKVIHTEPSLFYASPFTFVNPYTTDKLVIEGKYFTNHLERIFVAVRVVSSDGSVTKYMQQDGSFIDSWRFLEFNIALPGGSRSGSVSEKGTMKIEIDFKALNWELFTRPSVGIAKNKDAFDRVQVRFYKGLATTPAGADPYYTLFSLSARIENERAIEASSQSTFELRTASENEEDGESISLITGDYIDNYEGCLYLDSDNAIPTGRWSRPLLTDNKSIVQLMLLDRLSMTHQPLSMVQADLYRKGRAGVKYSNLLRFSDAGSNLFAITTHTIDHMRQRVNVTAIELKYSTPANPYTKVTFGESGSSNGRIAVEGEFGVVDDNVVPVENNRQSGRTGVEENEEEEIIAEYGDEVTIPNLLLSESGRIIQAENVPIFFPGSIREVTLSEDLPAGAYVHLVQGEDVVNAYGAIANNTGRWAHGFIKVAGVAGDVVMAYGTGHVNESTAAIISDDFEGDFSEVDLATSREDEAVAGKTYYLSPYEKGKVTTVTPPALAIQVVGHGVKRGGVQFTFHPAAKYSDLNNTTRSLTYGDDGELYLQENYVEFENVLNTPTTLEGYGITDGLTEESNANISGQWRFDVVLPKSTLTPSDPEHLITKAYSDAQSFVKRGDSVRSVAVSNITLSGEQTVADVSLVAGNLVLVIGQTSATENGVYTVATGAWTRPSSLDSSDEIKGAYHFVTEGTYANSRYINTNADAIAIGSTNIAYGIDFGAETDPTVPAHVKTISALQIANWNTAYGWGDHGAAGYFLASNFNSSFDARLATKNTGALTEGSNLYFTEARVRATPLTGYTVGANAALASTDTLLQALAKIQGQISARITGNQNITVTGDATGSGTTAIALTLANSGVVADTYGDPITIPQFTVDAKGRITNVTEVAIRYPGELTVTLGETVANGDFVSLAFVSGTVKAYKAIANDTGKEAHGFVKVGGNTGATTTFFGTGRVNEVASILLGGDFSEDFDPVDLFAFDPAAIVTTGFTYYLSPIEAGAITPFVPKYGQIQVVGQGISQNKLQYVYSEAVTISEQNNTTQSLTYGIDGKLYLQNNYVEFGNVLNTPTTLNGYGITDAVDTDNVYEDPTWLGSLALAKLTGADDLKAIEALSGSGVPRRDGDGNWVLDNTAFLDEFTEVDPIFTAHPAYGISAQDITDWNQAHGWGDHAQGGYLTSFTETDPTVPSHVKAITSPQIANWNTAFGWGNHAGLYSLLAHNHTLDTLSNVTITNNTTGEILRWNGTAWVNATLAEAGVQPSNTRLTDISSNLGAQGFLAYVDETHSIETRSIMGASGEIEVANGNGVGANPEISLASSGVTPASTDGFDVDSKGRITSLNQTEVANWSQAHDDNVIAAAVSDFGTNAKVLTLTKRSLEEYVSNPFSFPIASGQASSLTSNDSGNIGAIWYTENTVNIRNNSNQVIELKQIVEPTAEEPTVSARTGVDFSYNYPLANISAGLPSTVNLISWPDWMNEPTIGSNSILISGSSSEVPNKPGRVYPVSFRVTNGVGQSRTFTIRIRINDTATAPTVANPIPDQAGTVGTLFQYTIPSNTFSAASGHSIVQVSASIPTGSSWLSYNASTQAFIGTPPSSQVIDVVATGTDSQGLSATDIFRITVSSGSDNDPIPATYDPSDSDSTQIFNDGTVGNHVLNANVSAWDFTAPVDGSYRATVLYSWGGDNMSYALDSKVGTWDELPTTGVGPAGTALQQFDFSTTAGAHTLYFRGTGDTADFYNIVSVEVQLIQGGTNLPPRIANQPPTLTGRQNIAFDATLSSPIFVDDDGTVVSITASGLPAGLTYSNGRIIGTPTGSGNSVVTLTATDDDGATTTTQFLIIIGNEVVISTGTTEVFATFSF